jgi:hypothetical protein
MALNIFGRRNPSKFVPPDDPNQPSYGGYPVPGGSYSGFPGAPIGFPPTPTIFPAPGTTYNGFPTPGGVATFNDTQQPLANTASNPTLIPIQNDTSSNPSPVLAQSNSAPAINSPEPIGSYDGFPGAGVTPSYSGFPGAGAGATASYSAFPASGGSPLVTPEQEHRFEVAQSKSEDMMGGLTPLPANDTQAMPHILQHSAAPLHIPEPVASYGGFPGTGGGTTPSYGGFPGGGGGATPTYTGFPASSGSPLVTPGQEHRFEVAQSKSEDMMATAPPTSLPSNDTQAMPAAASQPPASLPAAAVVTPQAEQRFEVAQSKSQDMMAAAPVPPPPPVATGPAFTVPTEQHFGDVSAGAGLSALDPGTNVHRMGRSGMVDL